MNGTLRDWRWMGIVAGALWAAGCFSGGGGGLAGEGGEAGSSAFESPGPSGASCASLCSQIASACGTSTADCNEECTQDQGNSASCGESSQWSELLRCCDGADFAGYCDEDGFDPCQGGVCEQLRPEGASGGC